MINNFSINDIDYLVLSGSSRLDTTEEYDISYYENYIQKNIEIISKLLNEVKEKLEMIKDEPTKRFIAQDIRTLLEKSLEENTKRNPRVDSETHTSNNGVGYIESHKYAKFIERDLAELVRNSYSKIIEFMNDIYGRFNYAERKGMIDEMTLWKIFEQTKQACQKLGIHSPDEYSLYKKIETDILSEKNDLYYMEVSIDEENTMEKDVIICCLPYTITAPYFTWQGVEKYEMGVSTPRVYVNRSYIDEMDKRNMLNSQDDQTIEDGNKESYK